jgi:hypothetical protein
VLETNFEMGPTLRYIVKMVMVWPLRLAFNIVTTILVVPFIRPTKKPVKE